MFYWTINFISSCESVAVLFAGSTIFPGILHFNMAEHWSSVHHTIYRNPLGVVLLLITAATIFGGVLISDAVRMTQCQNAIRFSHTASEFTSTYLKTNISKPPAIKVEIQETIGKVLDDRLPAVILELCVSFHANRM